MSFPSDDFFANLRGGIPVGLAVALVERGQVLSLRSRTLRAALSGSVVALLVKVRFNLVGAINSAGITWLSEVGPLIGLEMRALLNISLEVSSCRCPDP
jgi:galactitol-specific phosphotransferase system IIC component